MSTLSKTNNDNIIHLGDRDFYLSVNVYNGKIMIHLRQYYRCYPDHLFPTKVGVALTAKEFTDIIKNSERIKQLIHDLNESGKVKKHHLKSSSLSDTT